MFPCLSARTLKTISMVMKTRHGRDMQSEKSNFFMASGVLRILVLAVIFYVSTFTVMVMMFLLQRETNLDVVAICNHAEFINTSIHLHHLSTKSVSVRFAYVQEWQLSPVFFHGNIVNSLFNIYIQLYYLGRYVITKY